MTHHRSSDELAELERRKESLAAELAKIDKKYFSAQKEEKTQLEKNKEALAAELEKIDRQIRGPR